MWWRALAASVGALAVLAVAGVYAASEWELRRTRMVYFDPALKLPRSTDDAEAKRQAILIGYWEGCHGKTGEGLRLTLPGGQRLTAPNLSSVLPHYSDGELERLLRYGVRKDGSTALMMPADTFYPMGEAQIGAIADFLRRQPATEGPTHERSLSLVTRWQVLQGEFPLSADEVDPKAPRWGELPQRNAFERGRALASTVCAECHGRDFRGDPWDGGPALTVIAAYDYPQFERLLRTGRPAGADRDLGDMGEVARAAFVHFKEEEIADLYVFLRERAGLPYDLAQVLGADDGLQPPTIAPASRSLE